MTFKFTPELTFSWPVKVIEPDPNNAGKKLEHVFTARFATMDPDEAKAADAERAAILRPMKPDMKAKEARAMQEQLDLHDRVALRRVLRGWDEDLQDADGKPIPFNDETFALIFRFPHIRHALVRAYGEAISDDGGRLGN
ncbi:hypothetical protein [Shinella sp. G-2]|uniref:hypothetical protein n=1 Tax=Shinella sp. G-2 TaxID=3133141 RepID=UPI003D010BA3